MAPTVAVIKLPIVPSPVLNPITPNNQPPSSAPTKPTIRSPTRPKPLPVMILPAKKPAMIPMIINQMKCYITILPAGRSQTLPFDLTWIRSITAIAPFHETL